jgi:predicted nucleic acid-binding Zn ribbon protein
MTPDDTCIHHGEHRRFCSECGARLQWRCDCGVLVGFAGSGWYPMEWRYCPGCGVGNPHPQEVPA